MDCVFCSLLADKVILQNEHFLVTPDKFPVLPGHVLIIAHRHAENMFELSQEEFCSLRTILLEAKAFLEQKYHPDGYNIGTNSGTAAGQSIQHFHLHIIPRYNNPPKDSLYRKGVNKLREYYSG